MTSHGGPSHELCALCYSEHTSRDDSFCGVGNLEASDRRFEALFSEHKPLIEAFFRKRGCGESSRDLAQETFLKAYARMGSLRDEAKITSWLFAIARHTWINALRAGATQARDSLREVPYEPSTMDHHPAGDADPYGQLLRKEKLSQLERAVINAILQLSPRTRQCVCLRVYQGLKYHEIARIMDVDINTVRSHLNRAKKQLKQLLGKQGIDSSFR